MLKVFMEKTYFHSSVHIFRGSEGEPQIGPLLLVNFVADSQTTIETIMHPPRELEIIHEKRCDFLKQRQIGLLREEVF